MTDVICSTATPNRSTVHTHKLEIGVANCNNNNINLWTKRCFEPCFIRDKQQRWCYVMSPPEKKSFSVSLSWTWLNCDPHQQYWQRYCPAEPIPIRCLQSLKWRQLAGNYMLVSVVRWFPFEGWECCMIIRWVLQNVSVKRALFFF